MALCMLTKLNVVSCAGKPFAASPEEVCGGGQWRHSQAQQVWQGYRPGRLCYEVRNKNRFSDAPNLNQQCPRELLDTISDYKSWCRFQQRRKNRDRKMGHSEDEKEKRLSRKKKTSDGVFQIFSFRYVILGVSIVFYKQAECLGIFKK